MCRGDVMLLVPVAGVEPAPCRQDRILSPARLPIPSHRLYELLVDYITKKPK